MREGEIVIKNRLGLHARAAAKLSKAASSFSSEVVIFPGEGLESVDAKSLICVLTLGASKGKRVLLRTSGPDELEAFESIKALFESGFGEN